jgi:hypothetical protein
VGSRDHSPHGRERSAFRSDRRHTPRRASLRYRRPREATGSRVRSLRKDFRVRRRRPPSPRQAPRAPGMVPVRCMLTGTGPPQAHRGGSGGCRKRCHTAWTSRCRAEPSGRWEKVIAWLSPHIIQQDRPRKVPGAPTFFAGHYPEAPAGQTDSRPNIRACGNSPGLRHSRTPPRSARAGGSCRVHAPVACFSRRTPGPNPLPPLRNPARPQPLGAAVGSAPCLQKAIVDGCRAAPGRNGRVSAHCSIRGGGVAVRGAFLLTAPGFGGRAVTTGRPPGRRGARRRPLHAPARATRSPRQRHRRCGLGFRGRPSCPVDLTGAGCRMCVRKQ